MLQISPLPQKTALIPGDLPLANTSRNPPLLLMTSEKVAQFVVAAFSALATPGFFSSREFYQSIEVVLGLLSGLCAIGVAVFFFVGKTDCSVLAGTIAVTSFIGWQLAGQVATLKPLSENIAKLEHQLTKQTTQAENYKTLFENFATRVDHFANRVDQLGVGTAELAETAQEFRSQLHASDDLWKKLFEERTSLHEEFTTNNKTHAESIKSLTEIVKKIQDPSSLLNTFKELDHIVLKLQKAQQELSVTEGRVQQAVIFLQDLEENHKDVLSRYEQETKKFQASNRDLASTIGAAKSALAFA